MENYEPNSNKYKESQEKKKLEKAVSGSVTTKKKTEARKIANAFISDDIADVKTYILMDVLIPSAKKAISEIVSNGINMILYGKKSVKNNTSKNTSKISYRDYYDDKRTSARTVKSTFDFDDIILDNRGEAENVLDLLDELIREYGQASVADLYQLVGISCNYAYYNYGWTDITKAYVDPIREGYLLRMPKAKKIK